MGDRVYASIRFSGHLTAEQAAELVEQLNGQGCNTDDGDALKGEWPNALTVEHLKHPHAIFHDEQCNYADMDGVEAFCKANGVSYLKTWAAGGGFSAGYELYNAVTGISFRVPGDDEPTIGIAQLREFAKNGTTLAEAVAYLEGFTKFEAHYPALEISG